MSAQAATAGRRGWIISDGKRGNEVQSGGVLAALGLACETKLIEPKGLWRLLSPWGPVSPSEHFGGPQSQFRPPWPDFAIATGRLTTPYIRALKRAAGLATYTIILQDPKVSVTAADLFWVPEHDARRGANVVTTLTAPHGFSQQCLIELGKHLPPALAALPQPRIAVALGGPNGDYRYTAEVMAHLASALASLTALGAGLMITPSRRTPAEVVARIREVVDGAIAMALGRGRREPLPLFLGARGCFHRARRFRQHDRRAVRHRPARLRIPPRGRLGQVRALSSRPRALWSDAAAAAPLRALRDLELCSAQFGREHCPGSGAPLEQARPNAGQRGAAGALKGGRRRGVDGGCGY